MLSALRLALVREAGTMCVLIGAVPVSSRFASIISKAFRH
jgi:hypothetical protein